MLFPFPMFSCSMAAECSGCPSYLLPFDKQVEGKLSLLKEIFPEATIERVAESRVRNRADLVLSNGGLGLYSHTKKDILDLKECQMMEKPLEEWFLTFKKNLPDVKKGSIRLRVSPAGQKGVWFDFSNEDIKRLLDERSYLEKLMEVAIIEMGQKKKRAIEKDGRLALGDAELFPWTETYSGAHAIPLFSSIGSFSQAGSLSTRKLVDVVLSTIKKTGASKILEIGSGTGTFTLPLLAAGSLVASVEVDVISLTGQSASVSEAGLDENYYHFCESYERPGQELLEAVSDADALLVDPPRSGVGKFLDHYFQVPTLPKYFVYVSCYPETFKQDLSRLQEKGYELSSLTGVDQFPQTNHLEMVALLVKNS